MKVWLLFLLIAAVVVSSSAGSFVIGPHCAGTSKESSAVTNLRTINTAEVTMLASTQHYGTVDELMTSGLLDPRFRTTVTDYDFTVTAIGTQYRVEAKPRINNGRTDYYSGPDAVVRYGTMAPANLIDSPVF